MQNLRELISKALDEMKLQGASAKQLHIYRTTSFGNILRYFNKTFPKYRTIQTHVNTSSTGKDTEK